MPAGPDETHHHKAGEATEHVMKNSSSKTDNNASDHPLHNQGEVKGEKVQFRHHEANPGPVVPQNGCFERVKLFDFKTPYTNRTITPNVMLMKQELMDGWRWKGWNG